VTHSRWSCYMAFAYRIGSVSRAASDRRFRRMVTVRMRGIEAKRGRAA